jgi:hypothetical protein
MAKEMGKMAQLSAAIAEIMAEVIEEKVEEIMELTPAKLNSVPVSVPTHFYAILRDRDILRARDFPSGIVNSVRT